jgi:hypothetical protein
MPALLVERSEVLLRVKRCASEKGVYIHGRAHCTYNSEYHNANKDILVLKVWEQGNEGLGYKSVNKKERITVSQNI